jgi:serine/alanine adding enzyme
MNLLHAPDRPASDEPPAEARVERLRLQEQLAELQMQGKRLSRAIGVAKANNDDIQDLLQQRSLLSAHEQTLRTQMEALAGSDAPPSLPPPPLQLAPAESVTPSSTEEPALGALEVSRLTVAEADAWDRYVAQHPDATSYHLSGWIGVCKRAFGHPSHHLMAKRAGEIVGVLPLVQLRSRLFGNFLVSMPFLNYGGVLTSDPAARTALLDHAVAHARALGCAHIELRETSPSPTWPMRTDKVSMWLPLPASKEALWVQIGSKLRAQIKKGMGHGLQFEVGGVELLNDFYRVFSTNMRDLGTPVYAKRFFEIILNEAPGRPELVVGRDPQGKAVACALVLRHGDRMEVPWASTLRRANGLNANMALYWTMLSHACDAGAKTFDFGRSTMDASTHRFKRQWGAKPVPLYWHYWLENQLNMPQINPSNPKYKIAIATWKHLPVQLANLIGPSIAKTIS